ncbi:hypothetical protein DL771_007794 [Monosporascus sp. 5C6A]|nr:hypothetical protein DL771_007794 [Monosporascus sp. 5C6A]
MDNKSDLLQYARDFANQNEDLYALLGVDAATPKEDIHRAWRKKSLKYHPDKAGKDFDATKWQLFERARDVLSDPDARGAYDSARSAALLREAQRQAMDAKRRQMIEDLEARERGVKRPRDDDEARRKNAMSEEEKQRLVAAGRRRMEERQRQMREAEERERQRELEKQRERAQQRHRPNHDALDGGEDTTPDVPAAQALGGDEFDEKIADLERRLQESRARKAAKKARKSGVVPEPPPPRAAGTMEEAQETPIQDPGVTELKADDKKGTPPPSKAFSVSAPRFTTSAAAVTDPPRVKGDFSSTMARLRAAQAEKEARKQAKQEAAAAAAGSASQ